MDEQPKAYEHYLEEDPTGACRGAMNGCLAVAFVVAVIVIVAFIGWRLGY
jgi:hypothetical protein